MSYKEPTSASAALLDPHWHKAMEDEYQALVRNDTGELVPTTADMNVVQCKWEFRTKFKADGSLDKFKACLVAKGF